MTQGQGTTVTAADRALCGEHGQPLRWSSVYQQVAYMGCAQGCSTDSDESAPEAGNRLYFTPDGGVYVVEA